MAPIAHLYPHLATNHETSGMVNPQLHIKNVVNIHGFRFGDNHRLVIQIITVQPPSAPIRSTHIRNRLGVSRSIMLTKKCTYWALSLMFGGKFSESLKTSTIYPYATTIPDSKSITKKRLSPAPFYMACRNVITVRICAIGSA